jgi:hypothetical protein
MRLLIAELARMAEFARLTANCSEVAQELEPVTSGYDIAPLLLVQAYSQSSMDCLSR